MIQPAKPLPKRGPPETEHPEAIALFSLPTTVRWTGAREKLFLALQVSEHRLLNNMELGRAAGLANPNSAVHKAFKDSAFVALLKERFDFYPEMPRPERVLFKHALDLKAATPDLPISPKDLIQKAGLSDSQAYPVLKRARLLAAFNGKNIRLEYKRTYLPHEEISYISSLDEQKKYCLEARCIDLRHLYRHYPLHQPPNSFIVNLDGLACERFREIIATALLVRIQTMKAASAAKFGIHLVTFFKTLESLFPDITSLAELRRKSHIISLVAALSSRKRALQGALEAAQWVFLHAASVFWHDKPPENLIVSRDFPLYRRPHARPIEGIALSALDEYLDQHVVPCMEAGNDTPEVDAETWDLVIVIRHTGRRFSDLMGLLDTPKTPDTHCIQFDTDGDPKLFIAAEFSKTSAPIHVSLAHLRDYTRWGNVVTRAIERQRARVVNRPPCKDGRTYLFRTSEITAYGHSKMPTLANFNATQLPKVSDQALMHDITGESYVPSAHQFRHTVATEMINAGLDIYAVMCFMGHTHVATTERYIKLMQQELKRQLKASPLIKIYRPGWTDKEKIPSDFEQEDSVCGHPWKIPSCPARTSKVCVRKKAFPRHLPGIEKNIRVYQRYASTAEELGETESAINFRKVVSFNMAARDAIHAKGFFVAATDFFGKLKEQTRQDG